MKKSALFLIALVVAATVLGVFFIHPDYWGSTTRPWRLGLDLVGGTHLVYEIDMSGVDSADRGAVLDGIRDRIETRVNSSGVREPQVVTAKQGDSYRLIVDIAGIKDTSAAIAQIGETPFLVFAEESSKSFPVKAKTADGKEIEVQGNQPGFTPTTLTGRYVKSAQLNFNNVTRQPEVFLEFDADGAKLFEDITAKNVGKQLAIFVDNELLTAPRVNERITGGRAQITGQFTVTEAQRLVARFKDGALAAPIRLVSQQTIGATLGSDSLQKTLWAGLVGAVVVMLFMIVYYHTLGLFASIALLIYTVLLLSISKLFGITMTLAGIAGIILSIGMAVDANILIFERTKEELKKGIQKTSAIMEGFRRAWPSIRDSNIATMITSLVLYSFASSFIRGFALSLLLGVIVSMFTAITVTRTLLAVFIKEKKA
jgi:protein-export membrane protein SecD